VAKILVIDDETHIVHVVALKLRNAGHDVDTAGDGEEGYDAIVSGGGYDLVITDIQMPYMTGVELAQKLAASADTRDLPLVVLTARGYKIENGAIEDTGVRAILSKPFSPREVLTTVQEILSEGSGEGRNEAA